MARPRAAKRAETYRHEEEALLRPDVGTQAQFKKRKPPKTYRYDSSLSPALDWDGGNAARELGEWLLAQIEEASALEPPFVFVEPRRFGDVEVSGFHDAVARLKALSRPFLDWAGKAERLSFDVPTLPLFVHERLSTKAILETLSGHVRDRQMEMQLFADPQLPLHQQLEAYEHKGGWVNRLILGDSLVVMNSLLEYEGLGGQVQMIYIDPPYGVRFGSNFQPPSNASTRLTWLIPKGRGNRQLGGVSCGSSRDQACATGISLPFPALWLGHGPAPDWIVRLCSAESLSPACRAARSIGSRRRAPRQACRSGGCRRPRAQRNRRLSMSPGDSLDVQECLTIHVRVRVRRPGDERLDGFLTALLVLDERFGAPNGQVVDDSRR
jgi:hypothetical protein